MSSFYFRGVKVKEWRLSAALESYKSKDKHASLQVLLERMKLDINSRLSESSYKKSSKNILDFLDDIKALLMFFPSSEDDATDSTSPPSPSSPLPGKSDKRSAVSNPRNEPESTMEKSSRVETYMDFRHSNNNIKTLNNNVTPQINKECNEDVAREKNDLSLPVKRPIDRLIDGDEADLPRLDFEAYNSLPDDYIAVEKDHLAIHKGTEVFIIHPPSKLPESPCRPKLAKIDHGAFEDHVTIATSCTTSGDASLNAELKENLNNHRNLSHLKSMEGCLQFLQTATSANFDSFPATIWTYGTSKLPRSSKSMVSIMQYILTNYHKHCLCPNPLNSHERTPFIELLVPALSAFGKVTNLVSFQWCEKESLANKFVKMKEQYYSFKAGSRFMDALGTLTLTDTPKLAEIILVESSSGLAEENAAHTIDDSIKLFECSAASLRLLAASWKNARYDTFKKSKVFCLHFVTNKITLTATEARSPNHWTHIELASCTIPLNWTGIFGFGSFFNLLAILFEEVEAMQRLQKQLEMEASGLYDIEGPRVSDILNY
ncbi:hypothetical protein DM01DRAFT_1337077, partial [Hesseltinella vesiculosa]